jgi:hypothetical protein
MIGLDNDEDWGVKVEEVRLKIASGAVKLGVAKVWGYVWWEADDHEIDLGGKSAQSTQGNQKISFSLFSLSAGFASGGPK